MLSRVLLHVLETPVPVDAAVHRTLAHVSLYYVKHRPVVPLDNVQDFRRAERARIEWLTA